ncbi:protein multipolar spindle 1 isoform X2 [Tanacetum coccineum]
MNPIGPIYREMKKRGNNCACFREDQVRRFRLEMISSSQALSKRLLEDLDNTKAIKHLHYHGYMGLMEKISVGNSSLWLDVAAIKSVWFCCYLGYWMPACLISGVDYEYFVSFKFELLDDDISWDPSLMCSYRISWELRPNDDISGGDGGRFTDVLCRRFLRQVRLKERRKRRSEGSARRLASVDFPVDLCDTISNPHDANFTNWSHQVVDFILDSIKNITSHGKIIDSVEGIIGSLSLLLVRNVCTTLQGDGAGQVHTDT